MPEKTKIITDAELAVMSLLAEEPMHGYQIEQMVEERGMRDWTNIGFSSIYYILEKLGKIGWLDNVLKQGQGKGPARQIFYLTPSGEIAWKKAVIDAISHPHRSSSNFQLGLANLLYLEKEEITSALKENVKELQQRHQYVLNRFASYGDNLPWNVSAMFDLSLTQIRTEMNWIKAFIKEVDSQLS